MSRYHDDITMQGKTLAKDLVTGLTKTPKTISSKFLYDEKGSRLFEDITTLPEYYQTRTETAILTSSTDFLNETLQKLSLEYPDVTMTGGSADYTKSFEIPTFDTERTIVFFPGSTIGNFEPAAAIEFLCHVRTHLSNGDLLIIGVDRKKERSVIEAAYNDADVVTSAFNKNLLARINREHGSHIEETAFEHLSFYNEQEGRIEMHLQSLVNQTITLDGNVITFNEGETIHTENSYKFDLSDIERLCEKSGLRLKRVISDELTYFSVCVMEVGHR